MTRHLVGPAASRISNCGQYSSLAGYSLRTRLKSEDLKAQEVAAGILGQGV